MGLPKRIGRYEIIELIAQSAMGGAVYKARDGEFGNLIMLKVSPAPDATLKSTQRWVSQMKRCWSLRHPKIVTVYDVGMIDRNRFMAMEWVEGEPLDVVIKINAPLTLAEQIRIVSQISEALQFIHDQGIVYRDVKPSNIMLSQAGDARLMPLEPPYVDLVDSKLLTIGTPAYMSPEQLNGEDLDGRADIFSLGCSFYELVERRRPFEGESTVAPVVKILRDPPLPSRKACELQLPELQQIFEKTLAKDKNDRYLSCSDLQRDLNRLEERLESDFTST